MYICVCTHTHNVPCTCSPVLRVCSFVTQIEAFSRDQQLSTEGGRCFSVELVLFCNASDLQRQIYRRVLNSPALRSCLATSDPGQHLMCISALKKLCNHPILLHSNTLASVTESDGEQHDLTKVSVRSRDPAPHQHAGERDRERRGAARPHQGQWAITWSYFTAARWLA